MGKVVRFRKVEVLSKEKAEGILKKARGRFFGCCFRKKNGRIRVLNGRLGVVKYIKGGGNKVAKISNAYVTVFDVKVMGYRTVNLSTMYRLNIDGKKFVIV